MVARFSTKSADGEQVAIGDLPELLGALRRGELRPDSPLYDELLAQWGVARDHDAFRAAGFDGIRSGQTKLAFWMRYPRVLITISVVALGVAILPMEPNAAIGYSLGAAFFGAIFSFPLFRGSKPKLGWGSAIFAFVAALSLFSGIRAQRARDSAKRLEGTIAAIESKIDSVQRTYQPNRDSLSLSEFRSPATHSTGRVGAYDDVLQLALQSGLETSAILEKLAREKAIAEFSVNVDVMPPAWGTPQYFADASSFPEVGEYLQNYREYLVFWGKNLPRLTDSVFATQLKFHNVDPVIAVEARQGAVNRTDEMLAMVSLEYRTTTASLGLHTLLTRYDDSLSLSSDGKQWRYTSETVHRAIMQRVAIVTSTSDSLSKANAAFASRSAALMDSLRQFRIR